MDMAAPFTIAPEALQEVGHGLVRPECVLATAAGDLYVSHGGVSHIAPDGTVGHFLAAGDTKPKANGIAMLRDGSFLLANVAYPGGLYLLQRDGTLRLELAEVEGVPLTPCNFVAVDRQWRTWITVSTRIEPREQAFNADTADGFVVLADERGARIVGDGLGFTNEAILDPAGDWLYVNETFARRTVRFRVAADGALSDRQVVTEYGAGDFPDGLALDEEGCVWVACIVSNRLIRVAPDGTQHVVLDGADNDWVAEVEAAYRAGTMGRPHLDTLKARRLRNTSSLAFGGPDRRTIYLGNLLDDRIHCFESPVAGAEPVHWGW